MLTQNRINTNSNSRIPTFFSFIIKLYLLGLLLFGLLRIVLFYFININGVSIINSKVLKSFLIGMQFDSVVLAYILAIPILLLFIHSILKLNSKIITKSLVFYLSLVFPIMIIVTIADIPYFKFFGNRLSEASFQWLGNIEVVLNMIISNYRNLIILILGLTLTILSVIFFVKFSNKKLIKYDWSNEFRKTSRIKYTIFFFILLIFCFMGMRGRKANPIRIGDAFFCDNPILNQMGLNPIFTILKSYTSRVNLMEDELAVKNTQKLLQITSPIESISPIARVVQSDSAIIKPNIIIVLMESMSANYMGTFGNKNGLTPNLDSLCKVSWLFKNAYSAGIHTNNGVFSTLYSFPALKRTRPMSTIPSRIYSGLPYTLKQEGYKNMFFTTHDKLFDNLANFIPSNFFDNLYSAQDYPKDKIIGPFGVPDDYLYAYATNILNKQDSLKPFFATILSTSNHDPYILPSYFKSSLKEKDLRAVSYADWSIGKFMEQAKKEKWFDNTIFIFVADHGLNVGKNPYEISLSYHHVPIIMYSPKILGESKNIDNFIGQIDIFPTLMGILNFNYTNNTLGVDVLKNPRECIYFSSDDKIGCINSNWLYVYTFGGNESLYKYKNGDTKNYLKENKEESEKLKVYSFSQTQTSQWIYNSNKSCITKK